MSWITERKQRQFEAKESQYTAIGVDLKAANLHLAELERVIETTKEDLDDATKNLISEHQSHADLQLKSRDQLDDHAARVKDLENQYAARIKDQEEKHAAEVDRLEGQMKRVKRAVEAWDA